MWGTTQEQRVRGRRSSRQRPSRTRHPQKATWTRWDMIYTWIFGFCANTPCSLQCKLFARFFVCWLPFLEIAYKVGTRFGKGVNTRFTLAGYGKHPAGVGYDTCGACGFCRRLVDILGGVGPLDARSVRHTWYTCYTCFVFESSLKQPSSGVWEAGTGSRGARCTAADTEGSVYRWCCLYFME